MESKATTSITLDRLPPAVVQPKAHPDRSARYVHVNTRELMRVLEGEGFRMASVQVTGSRYRDPLYAKHQVDLRHPAMDEAAGKFRDGYGHKVGAIGTTARILFTNAHDGSSSIRLARGMWREVCSNGLVAISDADVNIIRHSGDAARLVIERAQQMARDSMDLFTTANQWAAIDLRRGERREFARLASVLRWGDPHRYSPDDILAPKRADDDRGDLWTVFNRVQENLVRGGLVGVSATGRAATSRPLSEIDSSNQFNADLWRLASEFAANRAPVSA